MFARNLLVLGSLSWLSGAGLSGAGLAAQQPAPPIAPPSCDYGEPDPNAPAEMAQFAFLIGDYAITAHGWTGTGWTPPRPGAPARWNGRYILGGTAIIDEWFNRDPGVTFDITRGANIRMYNPETSQWEAIWAANPGYSGTGFATVHLRSRVIDGVMTMWWENPPDPTVRFTFEVIDEDHWQRTKYRRSEAGEWQPESQLQASRIPCPQSAG